MKSSFCLTIDSGISLEEAWDILENNGIEILYGSEEEGESVLFVLLNAPSDVENLTGIDGCLPYELPPIDWEVQWAAHGNDFHDGYVHVDLTKFKPEIPPLKLQPGPGFGDLSHPTTRLALKLLSRRLHKQPVVDIGCGSGVLSLSAAALGADRVYGIDIDPEALTHSRQNALLNKLEKKCQFLLSAEFTWPSIDNSVLIVMNMIQSEQETAWTSLSSLHRQSAECITSGIPVGDRESYLELTSTWGWLLKEEIEEEGWVAFYFIYKLFN